jgi:hypothetical protein
MSMAAGIVIPPDYVTDLLNVAPGTQVIWREEITSLRGRPVMLSVDWIPADSTLTTLGVLDAKPLDGGLAHMLENHRPPRHYTRPGSSSGRSARTTLPPNRSSYGRSPTRWNTTWRACWSTLTS